MPQEQKVIVSVDADEPDDLAKVVNGLTEAGMRIDDVLDALCTVTGTCVVTSVGSLQAVPGVRDVELQRDVELPPDDMPQ